MSGIAGVGVQPGGQVHVQQRRVAAWANPLPDSDINARVRARTINICTKGDVVCDFRGLPNLWDKHSNTTVSERVPVSEIREVEVHVDRGSGMRWDGKDGFAHFDLDLPARATRELLLCYHIEAPSRVQLPPL